MRFVLALILFGRLSSAQAGYQPIGRMIDIGGRRLHLYCTGSDSPTIVLVAGGGAYGIDWALVQPKIAEKTRVCSYDRAGLGWSDSGPEDETVEQTVADLYSLLHASGEKSPYLLVGASIGGIFIRAYQHAYPGEVAGLVFSNSSNRVGMTVKNKAGLLWELSENDIRSAYPRPSTPRPPEPRKGEDPFDRLPQDLQSMRLFFDQRIWGKWDPSKATPAQNLSWRKEFLREFEESEPDKPRPLGSLPVVVISSGAAASEADRKSRAGAGARLDFLSSNTIHITASGSGHEIHLYQPNTVIHALLRITAAVHDGEPLSDSSALK